MKLMLWGIAFILFGISICVMIIAGYNTFNITDIIGRISPTIGIVLVTVGFFSKDEKK
ncbi:MAG: hypothetical protein K1W00_09470 [Lachnospiraceae bacterium]